MPVPKAGEIVHCPICDSSMILRKGYKGDFWSCSNFPRCRGTRNVGDEKKVIVSKYKAITKAPGTFEQEDIWEYMLTGKGHLVIKAGPGVGKTWVGVQGCLRMPRNLSIFFVAFNAHIAAEANGKLIASGCGNVEAMTFHSLGKKIIRGAYPKSELNEGKMDEIIKAIYPRPNSTSTEVLSEWGQVINLARKLASYTKSYNLDYTAADYQTELEKVADHHGLDLNGIYVKTFPLLAPALDQCKAMAAVSHDFDDMIWLPIVLNLRIKYPCDVIFTDESQDLNVVQHELIFRAMKPSSRVFVVGDPRQSIYGFRGAHTKSMEELKRRLEASPKGVKEFPMTITQRCPKSHVTLAQAISPDIRALDDAPEGVIEEMAYKDAVAYMQPGDMVMCRVNARLIECAYALIRRNIRPILKGRDIGAGLLALIDKLEKKADPEREMASFAEALEAYSYAEQVKLLALGDKAHGRLTALTDKVACLQEFIAQSTTIVAMRTRIESLFEKTDSDEVPANAVVLGTVHKTKGLEAERVFILAPELIPFPAARLAWEQEQETNIAWVAATRAKFNRQTGAPGTLIFCGAIPLIYLKPVPEPPADTFDDQMGLGMLAEAAAPVAPEAGEGPNTPTPAPAMQPAAPKLQPEPEPEDDKPPF